MDRTSTQRNQRPWSTFPADFLIRVPGHSHELVKDNNKDVAVQNQKQSALNAEKNISRQQEDRKVGLEEDRLILPESSIWLYRQGLCRTGRRGREGQIRQRSGREIKKLKDKFIKKHYQLNKLAVQIKELENE